MLESMQLQTPRSPLVATTRPVPAPGHGELRLRVHACAVCRTDLHLVDGELPMARLPVVPGHEVVGTVEAVGAGVEGWRPGQRAGLPWLGGSCGACRYCAEGRENLCDAPSFTGCTRDGGFATTCAPTPAMPCRSTAWRSTTSRPRRCCAPA